MMSTPKVSIIIPVYNAEKYLADLFLSLLSQDCNKGDYEIIFVNDGSGDNSLNMLENFKQENADLNIRVAHQPNLGHAQARNTGFRNAGGGVCLVC